MSDRKGKPAPPAALVFELEYVGIAGREIKFAAVKAALGKKGVALTPALYVRYCAHRSPKQFVPALLKAAGKPAADEKTVEDVRHALAEAFAKPDTTALAGLKKILKAAADKGFVLGALTGMEEGLMQELADQLGLAEMKVALLSCPHGRLAEPGVEAWMKMARMLNVKPTRCIALTTSGIACRTALKARMKAVAMPDRFTECEDFSGADFFVDSLSQIQTDKLLPLVEPSW